MNRQHVRSVEEIREWVDFYFAADLSTDMELLLPIDKGPVASEHGMLKRSFAGTVANSPYRVNGSGSFAHSVANSPYSTERKGTFAHTLKNSPYSSETNRNTDLIVIKIENAQEPPKWIKNTVTGEIGWFNGTEDEAKKKAADHWGLFGSDYADDLVTLGNSFFGTQGRNFMESNQIRKQQTAYLDDVSRRINERAGMDDIPGVNEFEKSLYYEYVTYEVLEDIFLNNNQYSPSKGRKEINDLLGIVWGFGGEFYAKRKIPKHILRKVLFKGISYYFDSQELGVGSDRVSRLTKKGAQYFKNHTSNYLDQGTLILISLKKY